MFPYMWEERAAILITSLYWHSWQPAQYPHWKAIHLAGGTALSSKSNCRADTSGPPQM